MMLCLLRFGLLTVVIIWSGIQTCAADEPVPATLTTPALPAVSHTYQSRTFDEWLIDFRTELDPSLRVASLKALIVFGVNGRAGVVTPLLLDTLNGYSLRTGLAFGGQFGPQAPDSDDLEKLFSAEKLPVSLHSLGFMDISDFRFFVEANRGLARLAPRSVPDLVKYLEGNNEFTCARVMAMEALSYQASSEWQRILPALVAKDEFTATLALHMWRRDEINSDQSRYADCVKALLRLQDQSRLVQVVNTLGNSEHKRQSKLNRPLLEELARKNSDAEVKQAVQQVLYLYEHENGYPALPVEAPHEVNGKQKAPAAVPAKIKPE